MCSCNYDKVATAETSALFDPLVAEIKKRRLEAPAIFFLEMYKPLTSLAHTVVVASVPLLTLLVGTKLSTQLRTLLASRATIEQLIQCLETSASETQEQT